VECFAPSNWRNLTDGLQQLNWQQPHLFPPGEDPLSFIERSRSGYTGGWTLVVSLSPRQGGIPGTVYDNLPAGIRQATVEIHAPTASVTVLLTRFDLDKDSSVCVDRVLKKRYVTEYLSIPGGGYTIQDPLLRQRDAARDALTRVVEDCSSWQAERFRGLFATSMGRGEPLPAWAYLSTEVAEPFSDDRAPFLVAAGLAGRWGAWASDSIRNFRVGPPSWIRGTNRTVIVAANWPSARQILDLEGEEEDPRTAAYILHRRLQPAIVRWP
jgi:hypothetical protein